MLRDEPRVLQARHVPLEVEGTTTAANILKVDEKVLRHSYLSTLNVGRAVY